MKKEFNYLKYKKINKTWLDGYIDLYSKINTANINKTTLETYLEVYSNSINKIIQINQNYIISNEEIITKYSNGDIPEKTQYTKYKKHLFDISIEKIDLIDYYVGTWDDTLKHECEVVTLLANKIKKIKKNSTKDEDLNLNKIYRIMSKCINYYNNEIDDTLKFIMEIAYEMMKTDLIHIDTKERIAVYIIKSLTERLNECLAKGYPKKISNFAYKIIKCLFRLNELFIDNKIDVYPFDNHYPLSNIIKMLDSDTHKHIAERSLDIITRFSIKSSNNNLINGEIIFEEMLLDLIKKNNYELALEYIQDFIQGYEPFKKYLGKNDKFDISMIKNKEERYVAEMVVAMLDNINGIIVTSSPITQEKRKIFRTINEIIK